MNFSDSDSESYESDDGYGAEEVVAAPSQVQPVGYNSYGRPSMTLNNNHGFQQTQQESSDDGGSHSDGDGDSDSDDEPAAAAAPVQPRGKTFRPPVGAGDSSSSSSEDEGYKPSANNDAIATAQVVNPNPGPPRGKELRLIMKGGDSSSDDDEPLASKKSKAKPKAKTNGARKKAAPKKAAAKKSTAKASQSKKRKAPPAVHNDSDSGSDEECVAAVVCEGSDDEDIVMAVAENIQSKKRAKANDGTAKRKTSAKSKSGGAKKGGGGKKTSPKKGGGGGAAKKSPSTTLTAFGMPEVSAEKAEAARVARNALQEAVTSLPHAVTKSKYTVRSFGRIKPEYDVASPLDALFSSPHAIYPVGFSCDRFEFSPVHGRVIKMRCDILDGSTLREGREEERKKEKAASMKSDGTEPMLVDEKVSSGAKDAENLGDGPIFRVTWGEGVEEDKLLEPSCPFDPYVSSAQLGGDVDAIAVPLSSKTGKPAGLPEVGMRVSVSFDKGKMYGGSITKVKPIEKQTKNKKAVCNITIQYDDGVTEVAPFPDPDIVVAYQGCPPVETVTGLVTEMNDKPVRSVLAKTPLEAWGKTLISLGLIDEIMYRAALHELQSSRDNGFNDDAKNKKGRDDKDKAKARRSNRYSIDGDDTSQGMGVDSVPSTDVEPSHGDKVEDVCPKEAELRQKLSQLQKKLEEAKKRSKAASFNLAEARIATISPFAANPFLCRNDSTTMEASWLSAAIKKERAKMGNTGNKRKIVNPATIMDKSDTFFVPKIEQLVEGLPGTEFAPSYVFRSNRSASAGNKDWVHEAKIRHQKQQKQQQQKQLQKQQDQQKRQQQQEQKKQEKAEKIAKLAEAKAKVEQERELKRKLKEEELENRKRQREEEEEKKRKERVEKRLSQLNTQMDDRLFKESCMMRERNIMNFVKGMNKEFSRRRKAAELVVGNKIDRTTLAPPKISSSNILAPFEQTLPPLSKTLYDVEVVRIWDFLHSFSDAFAASEKDSSTLPSLDSLQDAINCIKSNFCDDQKQSDAIKLIEGIAIDLCKVISPSLTKILSSSTPNVDAFGKNGTEGGPQEDSDVSCLPVTNWSWREIAKMAIIYDVLSDFGYSKQECANLVKGYRSGGHPNSKEARRWKKIEESPVVMMYQYLQHEDDDSGHFRRRIVRASFSTPCTPSSVPSDWRFFLHNVKSRSSNSLRFMKDNVTKALAALKNHSSGVKDAASYVTDLEKCLAILDKAGQGNSSTPELHKAKQIAVRVLDATIAKCPTLSLSKKNQEVAQEQHANLLENQTLGFHKMYQMSKDQFKAMEQAKEEYMEAALRLKEELEGKSKDEANDDDDDDDDDDDEDVDVDMEGNSQQEKEAEKSESDLKEVANEQVKLTADSVSNGDSTQQEKEKNEGEKSESELLASKPNQVSTEEVVSTAASAMNGSSSQPEKDAESANVEEQEADGSSSATPVNTAEETGSREKEKKEPEVDDLSENQNDSSAVVGIVDTCGHPTVSEKDAHLPTEPAEGFPDGWVVRRIPRLNPNDKRTDRNWYSPKLELKFRSKADAFRFLEKLESANGDEAAAIIAYRAPATTSKAASRKPAAKAPSVVVDVVETKTEYDFCEDTPLGPDLIRRCLAVIRTLCASNSADQFIYPVDPQLYPGYYETVMFPTSLYDIGKFLQGAGTRMSSNHDDPEIEIVVAEVGRRVRTIVHNTIIVNSSNSIVNSAEEMLRIFERLFFDWVLAPSACRPALEELDDDRCIDHHESDVNSMVLLCDACEGKYNMGRLKPPLNHVPSGDWYCPRCVSGRSWLTVDPRIGRQVQKGSLAGMVQSCKFVFGEDGKPSILYCIKASHSGRTEYCGIEDVDKSIVGDPVEPLRCIQALAESPGYGFSRDSGIAGGVLPLAINPLVGDKAAQAALSSGVFKDTVSACVSLTKPPENFTAEEWTNLLMLLVTKCSQSEDLQELSSKLENKENSRLSTDMMTFWRARAAKNIVPNLHGDDTEDEEESLSTTHGAASDIPSVVENKVKKDELPVKKGEGEDSAKKDELPTDIVMKTSGEEASEGERPANMDISFQSSTEVPDEVSSSAAANASNQTPKETVISEEELLRRQREAAFLAKTKRERKKEEALMGYYVGNRLKSTAASFEEDFLSTVIKSTLCNQEEGLDLSAVRCRETCHYCGLSDVALGSPLCRTPSEDEWRETFPHAVHDRTTYMVAEVPDKSSNGVSIKQENGIKPPSELPEVEQGKKLLTIRVRVGGELISSKTKCIDSAVKNFDSAMQQFLPKNPIGFQSELRFRHGSNLSILSGSVTAHEICAAAAHRSRKEKLLAERRTFHRANMTREAALACGKSVPIGTDPFGRSYWVFSAEPSSLFVCQLDSDSEVATTARKKWHRFHKPEEIASVIVCLGKGQLCETLREIFPDAAKIVKDRSWSTLLYGRRLACQSEASKASPHSKEPKAESEEQVDYGEPFVEDEDVLVESENGKFLWDAVIVDVSKDPETDRVNGYLVHYKKWSSRFNQWVIPDRVVEPSNVNLEVQEEVLQDFSIANDTTPPMLEEMFAYKFLNSKKRARSTPASKVDLFATAITRPSASCDEKFLARLKGAILLIEAALPRGSVGASSVGSWNPQAAALWRNLVKDAQGPGSLMKCILLLEDAISPDWMHSQATQLYASIPTQWRAMGEATLPAVALRVSILDRCLKYQQKKKDIRQSC